MGDRTNFVQQKPLNLQCKPMMLAIYVVEDVSMSGQSDFGILSNRGSSSIFT